MATADYIDNVDAYGGSAAGVLDSWDDSTNTVRGAVTIRSVNNAALCWTYNVTGAVVDGTGYRKLSLSYVGGSGVPAAGDRCWLAFARAGDKGLGDANGPAVSVNDNVATFSGTSGKIMKDSGVAIGALAPKADPTFTGTPAAPTAALGTTTTQLATTAFVKAAIDVVLGGVSTAYDTLSEIATAIGLLAPKASPTFTGTPAGPTPVPGTNSTQLATTAFVAAAVSGMKLQNLYDSTQQTIIAGGALTITHGLGVKPKLYMAVLQCTTAEGGFSVTDEVVVNPNFSADSSIGRGQDLVPDATNINVRFGNQANAHTILNKTKGANFNITNSSWKLVVRAWACGDQMTKYFVDSKGAYLGGFDGAEPPDGATEVPNAPEDARQVWQGDGWSDAPTMRRLVLKSVVQARIIDAGKMPQAYAMLTGNAVYFARWFAPDRPEVYADDPDAKTLVTALGLDAASILAP
ncbi:hypothetical protein [Mesorhizobium sp. INR15]|uniref:hypothetical protein n=1 Tax=Mesorhizobium sp. INR15 TaxID=2654248 RepID=UPI0018967EBD|nr:hypothetical protein [Mesorhizobium sp. INR15]QPC93827.1 hypothetical protein GA829_26375 [Mesorhizobium sp. INR15]